MLKTIQSQLIKIEHGSYSIFSKGKKNPEKNQCIHTSTKRHCLRRAFSLFVPSFQFSTRLPLRETPCSPTILVLKSRLLMAPAVQSAVQDSLVFPIQWQGPTMVLHRTLDPEPAHPGSSGDNLRWPGDESAQHQQPDSTKEQFLIISCTTVLTVDWQGQITCY